MADRTLLITGANGFVGSHIALALHNDGCRLKLLCRKKDGRSAKDRIRQALDWHGITLSDRMAVVEGDVCCDNFGLGLNEFRQLGRSVDEVIHCASSTSFAPEKKVEIERANVHGTRVCLSLATLGSCSFFHHISTAYVAGKNRTECTEDLLEPSDFHNPYESSKSEAERMVAEHCTESGMGWSIYRPSIIIGDSATGRTMLFNAMYYPVKVVDYLQGLFRKDFQENGGTQAAKMGVTMPSGSSIHMPIRIDRGDESGGVINLVTIDYVVQGFMAIFHHTRRGGVYHLVNKRPCTIETLSSFAEQYYGVSGITPTYSGEFGESAKTALERRFDAFTRIYMPYMADRRRFSTSRADAILNACVGDCPEIDYDLFRRCIDYATMHGWESPVQEASCGSTR
jgi:nucleoside-diphosphate-sugar epimerase